MYPKTLALTNAGLLVVSGRFAPDVFEQVINAGADMYLAKPLNLEQVALGIQAVHRRSAPLPKADPGWTLDRGTRQLVTPDGARVDLSDGDLTVVECFVEARGETVTRDTLRLRLARHPERDECGLDQHDDPSAAPAHRAQHDGDRAAAGEVRRRLCVQGGAEGGLNATACRLHQRPGSGGRSRSAAMMVPRRSR